MGRPRTRPTVEEIDGLGSGGDGEGFELGGTTVTPLSELCWFWPEPEGKPLQFPIKRYGSTLLEPGLNNLHLQSSSISISRE